MLKRLRRKFCAITLLLVGLVLVAALGSTFVSAANTQGEITRSMLEKSLDKGFAQPPTLGAGENADRAFVVTLDVSDAGVVLSRSGAAIEVSSDQMAGIIAKALQVAWMKRQTDSGFTLALCDTTSRDGAIARQLGMDVAIFVGAMAALAVVVRILSKWALSPIERAWDQQRRFISDASHELKTPLAVICANSQILQRDASIPEGSRRWVESTAEEADHMKGLVEDLLTLARADEAAAGTTEDALRHDEVDLSSVVDEAALEFDAVAFERGCSIDSEVAGGIVVRGDADQLGRVVRTLLDNATKYAERNSLVRVRLTQAGSHAQLTVANRGPMIRPEDLEHLFDRFYRADVSRARESGGYGIGLSVAAAIVKAHKGKITAEWTRDGIYFKAVFPVKG